MTGTPVTLKERDAWMRAILASNEAAATKIVGLRLALHANIVTGRCDPSYRTLGVGTNMSERSAMRAIAALASKSWIEIEMRPGTSNSFRLLPPEGVTELCHPSPSFGRDKAMSPPGVTYQTEGGDTGVTRGVTKPCHPNRELNRERALTESLNRGAREGTRPVADAFAPSPRGRGNGFSVAWRPNPDRLTRDDALAIRALCEAWERDEITEADFDREEAKIRERARRRRQPDDDWPDDYRQQFWDAYPHRVGKKPTLAALGRLRQRKQGKPTWGELMAGVDRYVAYMRKCLCPVDKYLNPKTWITEERWHDDPAR